MTLFDGWMFRDHVRLQGDLRYFRGHPENIRRQFSGQADRGYRVTSDVFGTALRAFSIEKILNNHEF